MACRITYGDHNQQLALMLTLNPILTTFAEKIAIFQTITQK